MPSQLQRNAGFAGVLGAGMRVIMHPREHPPVARQAKAALQAQEKGRRVRKL